MGKDQGEEMEVMEVDGRRGDGKRKKGRRKGRKKEKKDGKRKTDIEARGRGSWLDVSRPSKEVVLSASDEIPILKSIMRGSLIPGSAT